MVLYPYAFQAAFDPNAGTTAPRDSTGQVFAVGDTAFTNPLPTFDLNGLPVTLTVGEFGYLPDFMVEDHTAVVWKSGEYVFQFATTIPVKGDEGEQGKSAYQSAVEQGFTGTEAEWLESLKGSNVVPTDEAIANNLAAEGTETRTAAITVATEAAAPVVAAAMETVAMPAIAAARETSASIAFYKNTSPAYEYEVITVNTRGKFIPGLVGKRYAKDFEKQGATGANFKPAPQETLGEFFTRTGADVIANTDGWRTSGNLNEIRGAQIKDGVIYHDFEYGQNGAEALGFRADGTSKIYSMLDGDTTAGMLADGVVNSFSFGPAVVRNGVPVDLEAQPLWADFNAVLSGRQILGQTATGSIVIITVYGSSGVTGIKGNEAAALAVRHGCHNAIHLDGGGSSQTMLGGKYSHLSSDASGTRPVAGVLTINTRVTGPTPHTWRPLTPAAGVTGTAEYMTDGSWVQVRAMLTGDIALGTTTVATGLPVYLRPDSVSARGVVYFTGSYAGTSYVAAGDGAVGIAQQTGAVRTNPQLSVTYPVKS